MQLSDFVDTRDTTRPSSKCARASALAAAIASAELLSCSSVWALCTPPAGAGSPPSGTVVDCTGLTIDQNGTTGYGDGTQNGLTINIHAGAQVQGEKALFLGDNNTILNSGLVLSSPGGVDAGSATINNSGTISSPSGTAIGVNTTIAPASFVPRVSYITNYNSGIITGLGGGIQVGDGIQVGTATINNLGSISGARAVGIYGPGMNATVINSGTISGSESAIYVGGGSTTIFNSGTLIATNGSAILVGIGSATIFNSGTLTGSSSLSGATAVLFEGAHDTLTLAPGSVINGAVIAGVTDTLQLGGTGNGTFDVGLIGVGLQYQGFGVFNKVDASTWTLTGSGAQNWTISQGTLVGDTNSLKGALLIDNAALVFNQSFNGIYAGAIFGTGSVTKEGSGTITLTAASTYAGPTNVNAGTLSVNGSLTSAVFVNAGGTLGGTGIVGNATINGGTLAPGNSIGTLTVQGSLVFTTAATYMVEVSAANADRVDVTGAATLGGIVRVASPTNSFRFNSPYTILTSAGLGDAQFNALATPTGIAGSLIYSGNNVQLNLTSALGQLAGLTANQRAVASALDAAFNAPGGQTGGLGAIFLGNLPQNLAQAAGETAVGSQQTTFNAMTQFITLLLDPFIDGRGNTPASATSATPFAEQVDGANAYASAGRKRTAAEREAYAAIYRKASIRDSYDPRWSVWAAGFGGSQTSDGNAALGSNNTTSRVFGVAAGADYIFSPRTIAGFALAGGGTGFSVANGGSGRSDLFQAGAFVRHNVGSAYISGAVAYGWQDITTDRTVTIAGVDRLRAQFNASAFSGRVEGGYRFVTPWMGGVGITPYAAGQFTTFDLPAYAEQVLSGANTFALGYAAKSVTATRSELGLRTDKSFAMQDAILTVRGRFAWAHDYNSDRNIGATFQTLPGASFVVGGAAQATDLALTTASAELKWRNGFSLAGTFEGEFSGTTTSYAGKGVARYAW
jgi:autotransporter-associated beta strand protein